MDLGKILCRKSIVRKPEFHQELSVLMAPLEAREMVKVLNADYEAVDTERNLEDAIAAAPELLFDLLVVLLARQHYLFSDAERRHFIDLVFLAQDGRELILVELKRGRLAPDHLRQYMGQAPRSALLRRFLDKGVRLRGILATVVDGDFEPDDPDVCARVVDRQQAIEVLKRLRRVRLGGAR
ncbi:MAG: hypothetical protein FJ290_19025 [Planctomycetes bacterium]|nr:hypothetical protein [Planctomycetota bacterium]